MARHPRRGTTTTDALFADFALAQRLEGVDARGNAECVEAYARLYPEAGARVLPVAGGYAMYAGDQSPLTQAIGLGMSGPVTADELDRLEGFYREHGTAVHVESSPLADPSLPILFGDRGYRVEEYSNVLARRLGTDAPDAPTMGEVQVEVSRPDEVELWARTVVEGVAVDETVHASLLGLFLAFFYLPTTTCFLARIEGHPAGGGAVATGQGVAALFGAGTRPEFRNRGVQTALLQARLVLAREAGCDVAMVITMPGSTSQRNAERQGFRVMYTRSKLVHPGDGDMS